MRVVYGILTNTMDSNVFIASFTLASGGSKVYALCSGGFQAACISRLYGSHTPTYTLYNFGQSKVL